MSNKNSVIYNFKYKKEVKNFTLDKNPSTISDIYNTFLKSFSAITTESHPQNAVYFLVTDPTYRVKYMLQDPADLQPETTISIKLHADRLPIERKFAELPKIDFGGPNVAECTVKLKGLPWESGEEEIVRFFEGLDVLQGGVHISYLIPGLKRHNGDAYVEFNNNESAEKALQKTKNCIGGRYIDVVRTTKSELERAKRRKFEMDRYMAASIPFDEHSTVVKLMGLPWEATYTDVYMLLDDVPVVAIHFPKDRVGRPSGVAFVELANPEFAARALSHNREYVGRRFVEIRASAMPELMNEMADQMNTAPQRFNSKTHCVSVRNIPPSINNFAIESFFTQESIPPYRIHKKINGSEAYCEFKRREDSLRAAAKNGALLGGCAIEIRAVPYEEVARNVGF